MSSTREAMWHLHRFLPTFWLNLYNIGLTHVDPASASVVKRSLSNRRVIVANHPSALKRERQARKRRDRNRTVTSKVKTAVKKARLSLTGNNPEQRAARIREATSVMDRAVSKGVIPRKRASRKISRMTRKMNQSVPAT